ncbi:sigma-70 family RNA polymerase sigma factor [Echinicola sp. CAU 1574]|uniref:Sigma-70 family RNA polymerase sigma factor n=1 Tax=Echinicola arenosa TaxID=2774144 RepID=A0ABR9AGF1_9BACT|nr:sigma-70 family RNA polymerase sigma factor [Echinicola arenosa]MBD8487823.1 sigma-70 family RNA polymerase sigma factor [Echinicola arenosa]
MSFIELLYQEEDDAHLWQRMKKGDKEAFDKIYVEHIDHLVRYGHSFTQDASVIDDNIQEVFCRIWQKRSELKETSNIRYYLLASFRNELLKDIRKKKKSVLLWEIFSESSVSFNASLEATIIQKESQEQLHKKLNHTFGKLSSRQKEIVYLKYYNELTFGEIGEMMGLEKKAVYNAVSKAMIILRKELR